MDSVDEGDADEEREEQLRVLDSGHQQLVERVLEQSLVHSVFVKEDVGVDLNLHRHYRNLVCGDFHLVRLAVEVQALDGLHHALPLLNSVHGQLLLSSDEGELKVGVQVVAGVLERQLELLDALVLLDSEGD